MSSSTRYFGRNATMRGNRIYIYSRYPDRDGFWHASFYFNKWEPVYADLFVNPIRSDIGSMCGKIPADSPDLIIDDTGRLSAEGFAEPLQLIQKPASYKSHRIFVSKYKPCDYLPYSLFGDNLSIIYRVPDGEEIPDTIRWLQNPTKSKENEFRGVLPASEEGRIRYEDGFVHKIAVYRGFIACIMTNIDEVCTIALVVPEAEQYINMKWLIASFEQTSFDVFKGTIPVSDPDLYIDDLGIIREDLLTKTFPVNWREATYKGFPVKVGAHNDTHHFVTHHADVLLPRGVLPAFLQPATGNPPGSGPSAAIQTGPQDFMAKIALDDPNLRFC